MVGVVGEARATRDGTGRRRVTIVDVAQHAGVSTAAVSKVLRDAYGVSPQMRTRVRDAMETLGYRPSVGARGMRGSTYTIGVSSLDPHNPFFAMLLEGVVAEMDDAGYRVLVTIEGARGGDELETARSLVDRQMDGLILITPCLPTADLHQLAAKVPVVLLGRHGEGDLYDSVASDDAAGSRLAVQHLVERGHRRIVYHTQPVRAPGLPELFREAGYREAMTEHGLRPDVVEGSWTHQGGETLAELIFARHRRPTAVHAGADVAAFGVLTHLWHHDLSAPDDLAVAGCDDTPSAAMIPIGLTSVDQQAIAMGREAARRLLARISCPGTGMHTLFPPRLAVRTST